MRLPGQLSTGPFACVQAGLVDRAAFLAVVFLPVCDPVSPVFILAVVLPLVMRYHVIGTGGLAYPSECRQGGPRDQEWLLGSKSREK